MTGISTPWISISSNSGTRRSFCARRCCLPPEMRGCRLAIMLGLFIINPCLVALDSTVSKPQERSNGDDEALCGMGRAQASGRHVRTGAEASAPDVSANHPLHVRSLQVESLEQRALLSVSPLVRSRPRRRPCVGAAIFPPSPVYLSLASAEAVPRSTTLFMMRREGRQPSDCNYRALRRWIMRRPVHRRRLDIPRSRSVPPMGSPVFPAMAPARRLPSWTPSTIRPLSAAPTPTGPPATCTVRPVLAKQWIQSARSAQLPQTRSKWGHRTIRPTTRRVGGGNSPRRRMGPRDRSAGEHHLV